MNKDRHESGRLNQLESNLSHSQVYLSRKSKQIGWGTLIMAPLW
jgi:hypothetical protein